MIMQRLETDAAYYARRAREEAERAAEAERPEVAAAHRGLSQQYLAMARQSGGEPADSESTPFFPTRGRPDELKPVRRRTTEA
jgi:hypothetical protein